MPNDDLQEAGNIRLINKLLLLLFTFSRTTYKLFHVVLIQDSKPQLKCYEQSLGNRK